MDSVSNQRKIPTCNILGVNIAAVDMTWVLNYINEDIKKMAGKYICISNVHTTVMSYEDESYLTIQNESLLALPDGGPLSAIGRNRGYYNMRRVTGPSLMEEIFKISNEKKYKHYFYGSSEETLEKLYKKLNEKFPDMEIVGMYSPPYRPMTEEENENAIKVINDANPDFIWIGLGAPKQEKWMAAHQGKVVALMIGVGAGFDYFAENIRRAPAWMQRNNLEWLYRLLQDPRRLLKRYVKTNTKFILLMMRGKR